MEYQIIKKEYNNNSRYSSGEEYEIVYNGVVYGEWDNEKSIDCPEDLILSRDLSELIDIGVAIGRQMEKDNCRLIENNECQNPIDCMYPKCNCKD